MADIWVKVLTPADSYALLSLDELKTILNVPLTDTSEDLQLNIWIERHAVTFHRIRGLFMHLGYAPRKRIDCLA